VIVTLRDGLRINVCDLGARGSDGSAPPLLLLHGFSGSSESWGGPILDRLSIGRRVIAVDLPGHGESDVPAEPGRFAFAAIVADLADLLDVLEVASAVWVGYSMGGRLALGAGLFLPDRVSRLVLESASPGLPTEQERTERRSSDELLARRIESSEIGAFVREWEDIPLFATQRKLAPKVRAELRSRRMTNRPEALAACLRGLGVGMQPSLWEALEHVAAPTLLIAGERDRKFVRTNERMLQALPDARLELISKAGHAVHLEQPEAWLSAVESFV
jgi:2-succinyl-6-hydroxy-2,4-cyclohexadiene-1-carboxylate synthase